MKDRERDLAAQIERANGTIRQRTRLMAIDSRTAAMRDQGQRYVAEGRSGLMWAGVAMAPIYAMAKAGGEMEGMTNRLRVLGLTGRLVPELAGSYSSIDTLAAMADAGEAHPFKRRNRTWTNTTVGAVLTAIAARHSATASVHPDLASLPIDAIEQHNKADMAFVQDLGRHFDAVATWKDKRLVFMPVGSKTTASGKTIAARTLTRQDGANWSYESSDRDAQNGVEAQYHVHGVGRRTVSTGGSNPHRLKRVYASKANAERAAKSNLAKRQRSKDTLDYDLAVADPRLLPNMAITLSGWDADIDATKWLVESIDTTFTDKGMTQKVKFEGA